MASPWRIPSKPRVSLNQIQEEQGAAAAAAAAAAQQPSMRQNEQTSVIPKKPTNQAVRECRIVESSPGKQQILSFGWMEDFGSYDLIRLQASLRTPPLEKGRHRLWELVPDRQRSDINKWPEDYVLEILEALPLPFLYVRFKSHCYSNEYCILWPEADLWKALHFHMTRCSSGGCDNEMIDWYVGINIEDVVNMLNIYCHDSVEIKNEVVQRATEVWKGWPWSRRAPLLEYRSSATLIIS